MVGIISKDGKFRDDANDGVLMYDVPFVKETLMVGIFVNREELREVLTKVLHYDNIDILMGINTNPLDEGFTTFKYVYITTHSDTKEEFKDFIHKEIINFSYGS
jgi:hypothetical protein